MFNSIYTMTNPASVLFMASSAGRRLYCWDFLEKDKNKRTPRQGVEPSIPALRTHSFKLANPWPFATRAAQPGACRYLSAAPALIDKGVKRAMHLPDESN